MQYIPGSNAYLMALLFHASLPFENLMVILPEWVTLYEWCLQLTFPLKIVFPNDFCPSPHQSMFSEKVVFTAVLDLQGPAWLWQRLCAEMWERRCRRERGAVFSDPWVSSEDLGGVTDPQFPEYRMGILRMLLRKVMLSEEDGGELTRWSIWALLKCRKPVRHFE